MILSMAHESRRMLDYDQGIDEGTERGRGAMKGKWEDPDHAGPIEVGRRSLRKLGGSSGSPGAATPR